MMWAKDYPLGTVMLGVFDVWLWVANVEIDGVRYWREHPFGTLHESVNAELFYILY